MAVAMVAIIAIVSHKYAMHGFLWVLHKSHHQPRHGNFERGDWFGAAGAISLMVLLMKGDLCAIRSNSRAMLKIGP